MLLTSTAFENQTEIPAGYTCKGPNHNPPLRISDVPPGTQSLAIITHDPDAPNGDFTHWTVWNIPPNTTEMPAATVPTGSMQGVNGFNMIGYAGPCPPSGMHQYIFELYALDTRLPLPLGAKRQELETAMQGHVLAQSQLTAQCSA
jgi:Raf kinase inhibitor-like YbhB/YbcL family protein